MNYLKKLIAISVFSVISMSSSAELIEQDWLAEGDGLSTLDTSTGLEWLDFSLTHRMSVNEVVSELDGSLSGWRLPTADEVEALMSQFYPDGTVSGINYLNRDEYLASVIERRSLFGETYGSYSTGLYLDGESGIVKVAGVLEKDDILNSYFDYASFSENSSSGYYGVFLVADSVPVDEPIDEPIDEDPVNDVPVSFAIGSLALALVLRRKK